jgi:cytochrome P450
MLAGSDTTAIYLRAIFYYLLRHPSALYRVLEGIQTAESKGRLSPIITYKESSSLPYLDACIKESGRIHPSIGLPLERVVPPAGLEIDGYHLPAGTVVRISAWTSQYDKDVFGPDADEWRPERWLVDAARRTRMERAMLLVSSGGPGPLVV